MKGCHYRDLTCKNCNKEFRANSKPAKNYFCSSKCYHTFKHGSNNPNYKGGNIKFICLNCNKDFELTRMQAKSQKGKFCGRDCAVEYKKRNSLTEYEKKIHISMKGGMAKYLKGKKGGKKWKSLVDYDLKDLMVHLESLFTDGMSWDNYGKWHVDHIIPKSYFKFTSVNDESFKQCWALKNLQPLWAKDNMSKGGVDRMKNKKYEIFYRNR